MCLSDDGRRKNLGRPVVIGGDNLPVGIGLTDLPNNGGGPVAPLVPPVPASLYKIELNTYQYDCQIWSIKIKGN